MNAGNYSQTIARELVHKRSIAEVLITSVTTTPATWICHAQLPRRHSFHTDTTGEQSAYHDPLLVLEAFRQACIAASHASYDVPLDARYTVRYYELSILDLATLKCGPQVLDLELNIAVRNEFRRGGDGPVHGLDVAAVVIHEGTKVMELSGAFGWMSLAKWEAFRGGASWDAGATGVPGRSADRRADTSGERGDRRTGPAWRQCGERAHRGGRQPSHDLRPPSRPSARGFDHRGVSPTLAGGHGIVQRDDHGPGLAAV